MFYCRQIARAEIPLVLRNTWKAAKNLETKVSTSCARRMPRELIELRQGAKSAADSALLEKSLDFPVATEVSSKNRFMKSAMSELLCGFDIDDPKASGIPSSALINLYRKFAEGHFGVVVTGAIMVNSNEIEAPGNVTIDEQADSPERQAAFRLWSRTGKANGTVLIGQIYHPGLHASDYIGKEDLESVTGSREALEDLLDQFVYAALYVEQCGFDGVEIACSYGCTLGYLISPNENQRTDEYGGPFENRARALFRIVNEIRKRAKNNAKFVVGLKLDVHIIADDCTAGQFVDFTKRLEAAGVDYFTITGGRWEMLEDLNEDQLRALSQPDLTYRSAIKTMQKELQKARVFIEGGFVALKDMNEALKKSWAHGISLARPAAAEPHLPRKMIKEGVDSVVKRLSYRSEFQKAHQIAGTQLWQHGTDRAVLDSSDPEHMEMFEEGSAAHEQAMKRAPLEKPVIGYPKVRV